MNVYLFDATENASWDEHEAWVVIARSPEQGWHLVESGKFEMPIVRTHDQSHHERVDTPERLATPDDGVRVELLGAAFGEPRVVFAAFKRG